MSGTANSKPKRGYHPHHLYKLPMTADAVTSEDLSGEEAETTQPPADQAEPVNALTAYTRGYVVNKCALLYDRLQKNPVCKILFFVRSVHMIMALAIILVAVTMLPGDLQKSAKIGEKVKSRRLVRIAHLAAFCTHFGAHIWMTFVSGVCLYYKLSRHAFGDVQKILFPKYYSISSLLNAFKLIQFSKMCVNEWDIHTYLQLCALSICLLVELSIRLYVVPPMLQLISVKMAIEKSAGIGKEVGRQDLGPLINCPHYMAVHKTFRKVHMIMAVCNIITMMCNIFHLVYITA
ncbi:transmembrane protein 205-like [Melanaphis sacchari]|uniref:transmembrane protein 205-like n=1 Tax=Melanaphis sacchari TaxID=742174 RepID=UPI000DC1428C|nr:transmembrane protein 205-like [Melanaphis sacchari]